MNDMTTLHSFTRQPAAGGFTLIEVLIAVIILSIGLLGLASLQAHGLKNNHSAYLRSQAVTYGYDISERMRANRSAAVAGKYNIGIGDSAPGGSSTADTDLAAWLNTLAANLPSGDGATAINGRVITITVQWDDSRAGGATDEQFVFQSEL